MTTNNVVPMVISDTNRRFMMIQASPENVGKTEYWERVHTELKKPESKSAYFDYLMNKDISNFNPRKFPKTSYMEDTITTMRPQSAVFFQHEIEKAEGRASVGDEPVNEFLTWKARDMITKMNEGAKFPYSDQKFGREMKKKYASVLQREHTDRGTLYRVRIDDLKAHLKAKHWWVEL
jgi:hypothetical protein